MKKFVILMAAAMLLLGMSGQAMAYFSNGDLIQVVYSGTTEIATDEGSLSSLLAGGTSLNFSSPLANANVAYFDYVTTGGPLGTMWTSGPATGQTAKGGSGAAFQGAYSNVTGLYFSSTTTNQATVSTSNPNSYFSQMNIGATGGMAGFLPNADGETTVVANGPVQQTLYSYTPTSRTNPTGVAVATITTGNATPVPPSILLMGSGLLGLVGIGRKRTV